MNGWQPVQGWEGKYEVSREGIVRKAGGNEIGIWKNGQGYCLVRLSAAGRREMHLVHRLVAAAFCQKGEGEEVVNHIDHDRAHNNASNLEWCTQKKNLAHARDAGRMNNYWTGKRSPNAALDDEQVRAIHQRRKDGLSHMEIAREFGVSKRTVGRVLSGENYADVV